MPRVCSPRMGRCGRKFQRKASRRSGSALPLKHGFPARVVAPRLLGYKTAKYVYRSELADLPIEGHWGRRGLPLRGRGAQQPPASRAGHY